MNGDVLKTINSIKGHFEKSFFPVTVRFDIDSFYEKGWAIIYVRMLLPPSYMRMNDPCTYLGYSQVLSAHTIDTDWIAEEFVRCFVDDFQKSVTHMLFNGYEDNDEYEEED